MPCLPPCPPPNPTPLPQGGAIGDLLSADARVLIPGWAFGRGDIRFSEQLAGGTMMDAVGAGAGGSVREGRKG